GIAADLRIDPDHAPARVEERPARVAVVDRRVGLDRVDEAVTRRQRGNRALGRGNDADAEGVRVPERAADRRDGLTDLHLGGDPERHRAEPVRRRIDLHQAYVVVDVPADDLRGHSVAILELDDELLRRGYLACALS